MTTPGVRKQPSGAPASAQPPDLPQIVVEPAPALQLRVDPTLVPFTPTLGPPPRTVFGLRYTPPYWPTPPPPTSNTIRIFGVDATFSVSETQPATDATRVRPFMANLSATFRQFHFQGTGFTGFGAGLGIGVFDGRLGLGVMGLIPGLGSGILSIKLGRED